jgi:hypothetical protein
MAVCILAMLFIGVVMVSTVKPIYLTLVSIQAAWRHHAPSRVRGQASSGSCSNCAGSSGRLAQWNATSAALASFARQAARFRVQVFPSLKRHTTFVQRLFSAPCP